MRTWRAGILYFLNYMEKIIRVRVIPKSRKNKVEKFGEGYKVRLTAAPVDGKANAALTEIVAEHFSLKKSQVKIVSGGRSKNKLLRLGN